MAGKPGRYANSLVYGMPGAICPGTYGYHSHLGDQVIAWILGGMTLAYIGASLTAFWVQERRLRELQVECDLLRFIIQASEERARQEAEVKSVVSSYVRKPSAPN